MWEMWGKYVGGDWASRSEIERGRESQMWSFCLCAYMWDLRLKKISRMFEIERDLENGPQIYEKEKKSKNELVHNYAYCIMWGKYVGGDWAPQSEIWRGRESQM